MAAGTSASGVPVHSVEPISTADHRKFRAGFALVLMSLAMPFLVLFNTRYLLAEGYVSPEANQVIGALATILMLISFFTVGAANRAYLAGNAVSTRKQLSWTIFFGIVSFALIGTQVVNHSVNVVSHFGEIFVTTLGAADLYLMIGMVSLVGLRTRVQRLWGTKDHTWGMTSNVILWRFIAVAWLIMYVELYLL